MEVLQRHVKEMVQEVTREVCLYSLQFFSGKEDKLKHAMDNIPEEDRKEAANHMYPWPYCMAPLHLAAIHGHSNLVPILKQYIRNTTYLSLDNRFREEQAKRNVLNISQTTLLI